MLLLEFYLTSSGSDYTVLLFVNYCSSGAIEKTKQLQ